MQKRCNNCFELFEDIDGMCPYCGYINGEDAEAAYFLEPGTKLKNERYSVGRVAGQGGFGIVYKAWDYTLQRVVAIKEFFPVSMVSRGKGEKNVSIFSQKKAGDYEKHLERFRREARIMSTFTSSKHSIDTFDVFEENKTAYIVMEYVDSPTLKSIMKARKGLPLPETEAIDYAEQMLSILSEMHAKGVYHLDVALDNIFVRETESGKQLIFYDFGAARSEKNNKKAIEEYLIVKPGFAPPEQYNKNGKIGSWTDVYAVGANLYYMLTGTVPLEATDREHLDTLKSPAELEIVSPAVNNAVMRAMALNPELRYKSAKEFQEALNKEKVLSIEEELKRRKRNRNSFLAICSTIICAAVVFLVYFNLTNGKIRECDITVWAVTDSDAQLEKERYQTVIDAFHEYYPQITVHLEVMESTKFEQAFMAADKKNRPDLVETTYASDGVLAECISLAELLEENRGDFVKGLSDKIVSWDEKSIPLGMYTSATYKQGEGELGDLTEVGISEFLKDASGYVVSDTTVYADVQSSVAGRYEVIESNEKKVVFTDVFSVSAKSWNRKRAAKALLDYMLTDSAQETLHIANRSDYLPISETGFELYVNDIFRELNFLENTINQYTPDSRR